VNLSLPDTRVAVKICGLTNRDDARAALDAGADLLGFNLWPGSKRYLDLAAHAAWIAELPAVRIALLVNATLDEARHIAALPFIDALQLHGDEDAAYCAAVAGFGKPTVKALRVSEPAHFATADTFSTSHLLLDAQVPGAYGGTGVRVHTPLVRQFSAAHPNLALWLAGGLLPENVADAIRETRPRVVDVSSGVEHQPGRKDFAKMRAFCAAARAA
jgi:phosphoribosylanthranilate isomerase